MKKWKKKYALPLMGALFLVTLLGAGDGDNNNLDKGIAWKNYSDAISEGRFKEKNIMLVFTTQGDLWCDKMQKETFTNPQVISYLNEHFAMSLVDRDRFPTLAKKYKVDAMPTLWFLNSKGSGLTSTDGFMPPRQLLLLLEFIQTEQYKNNTFTEWKEGRSKK